jgi:hypothetical protein
MKVVNFVNSQQQRNATMLQVLLEPHGTNNNILWAIHPGLPVYDISDCVLGNVLRVYDQADTEHPLVGRAPIVRYLDRFPLEIATRLRRDGYLVVDSGLLAGDYFILPYQIADVTDKGVFLHFRRDKLLQL